MTRLECRKRLVIAVAACLSSSGCGLGGISLPPGEEVLGVATPGLRLACADAGIGADSAAGVIGAAGGRLRTTTGELTVPPAALREDHVFSMKRLAADSVGVIVEGRPVRGDRGRVRFMISPTLIIDVRRCDDDVIEERDWFVWRLNQQNIAQSQKLRTEVNVSRAIVRIDSTSAFMIAN
ncbi:MAG TPA: hypothetical protein VFZ24_00735 [Longimicrobiales bacterium]